MLHIIGVSILDSHSSWQIEAYDDDDDDTDDNYVRAEPAIWNKRSTGREGLDQWATCRSRETVHEAKYSILSPTYPADVAMKQSLKNLAGTLDWND